jgi:hypothetical protein
MHVHSNHLPSWVYGLLLANAAMWVLLVPTKARAADQTRCTCQGGGTIEIGSVRYDGNSDREIVTKVQIQNKDSGRHCAAVWISHTEIYPTGNPYSFHLKRRQWKEQREEGCGDSPELFLRRTRNYQFVLDADSRSIREMQPVTPEASAQAAVGGASSQSNANLWDAISVEYPAEPLKKKNHQAHSSSAPEFGRSAWVFARKEITGSYVGLERGLDQDKIVTLRKTHKIMAGQLGQIEAFHGRTALVRFYDGSRIEKFSKSRNAFRRWYDNIGGPYTETKDDLYTPLRACILEVSLDDLIEVNDYLDQQQTDRT